MWKTSHKRQSSVELYWWDTTCYFYTHRLSVPFFAKVHHHHLLCQQHWWCCYMFPFTMQSLYFQFLFGTVRLDFNLGWHFPICLTKYTRQLFFSWVYTATSLKWRLTNCFCKMSIVKARHHLIYSQMIWNLAKKKNEVFMQQLQNFLKMCNKVVIISTRFEWDFFHVLLN